MHLRIRPLLIVSVLIAVSYILITRVSHFIHIFSSPHSGIPLSQSEIKNAFYNSSSETNREAVIPQRIHQIYHDWSGNGMPHAPQWTRLRVSCVDWNPGWIHKLWSAAESREFLEREYPWFLPVYDNYRYPVQRVDALKYFLLRHYGGFYIDLDNGCLESLEPLRYYRAFTTDNRQGALQINIMGSVPQHPFFQQLTSSLPSYNWLYWPFPYITISYASGRWFLTSLWEQYHRQIRHRNSDNPTDTSEPLYRVIMDGRRGAEPWVFWTEGAGLSWENWDNSIFSWIGENFHTVVRLAFGIAMVFTVLIGAVVWVSCFRGRKKGMKTKAGLKNAVLLLSPELGQSSDSFHRRSDSV